MGLQGRDRCAAVEAEPGAGQGGQSSHATAPAPATAAAPAPATSAVPGNSELEIQLELAHILPLLADCYQAPGAAVRGPAGQQSPRAPPHQRFHVRSRRPGRVCRLADELTVARAGGPFGLAEHESAPLRRLCDLPVARIPEPVSARQSSHHEWGRCGPRPAQYQSRVCRRLSAAQHELARRRRGRGAALTRCTSVRCLGAVVGNEGCYVLMFNIVLCFARTS